MAIKKGDQILDKFKGDNPPENFEFPSKPLLGKALPSKAVNSMLLPGPSAVLPSRQQ